VADGSIPAIRVRGRVLVLRQPLVDKILVALGDPDAVAEARADAAANAEAERLSHGYSESKEDWLARLTPAERRTYDD
jgi:hypothetical protein